MGNVSWTKAELAILQGNITTRSPRQLVALLPGRTESAIRGQCTKLGLLRGYWHLPPHETLPSVSMPDAAYLAGHFDGEGCITMAKRKRGFKLRCSVTATYHPVLEYYQSLFRGSIHPAGDFVNKPKWMWVLSGYSATMFFLDTLLPFLREKRPQAQLALDFIRVRIQASHAYPREDIKQLALQCYDALKAAKKAS